MKFYTFLVAACLMAIPQAQAADHAISVNDVHNFVMQTNSALNSPSSSTGRAYLERIVADNAIFENRIVVYDQTGNPYQSVSYQRPVMSAYYRYPYGGAIQNVSMRALDKYDYVNTFSNKKNMIYGYWTDAAVMGIRTAAHDDPAKAIVDVDIKEYSLGYEPGNPDHMMRVMHANAKCKMYLHEGDAGIKMTRMDCNMNSTLPF